MTAIAWPSASRPVRILLVDDHPVVRLGFEQILSREPDLEVCGGADSVDQALAAIRELRPDLVVVDISLQGESGLQLVKRARDRYPDLPLLVCSMHDASLFAHRSLQAGALGYVGKRDAPDDLVTAVRTVLRGERYLTPKLKARMEEAGRRSTEVPRPEAALSNRELEVFAMIGHGHGTREIAERLGIAFKTVETYRENIKQKLAIDGGPELARRAVAWVLEEPER